jgi:hypothetical protein
LSGRSPIGFLTQLLNACQQLVCSLARARGLRLRHGQLCIELSLLGQGSAFFSFLSFRACFA